MHILSVSSHIRAHTQDGIIVHGERVVDIHSCYTYRIDTHGSPQRQQEEEERTYPVLCCAVLLDDERSEAIQKRAKVDEKKKKYTHTRDRHTPRV